MTKNTTISKSIAKMRDILLFLINNNYNIGHCCEKKDTTSLLLPHEITTCFDFVYAEHIIDGIETISTHRTKKGAYLAMRRFINKEYNEWREDSIRYGKQRFKFGYLSYWGIREKEVLD